MNKKLFSKIAIVLLGFYGFAESAFANCGTFDDLVTAAQSFEANFAGGAPGHLNCNKKPPESIADNIIGCFEASRWQPARTLAMVDVHLASLYGLITGCYRSGIGQQDPGKKAYANLVAATQVDPTYEPAWLGFSDTIIAFKQLNFIQKGFVQMVLGISIDHEVQVAIQGLSSLPLDAEIDARLTKLRSFSFGEYGEPLDASQEPLYYY